MKKSHHFFLLALRHSNKHVLQTLLLILGVALGVAMIVGVDLANQSAHQAFMLSLGASSSRTTHQIVAGSGGVPTSLYEDLRLELKLKEAAPVVTGRIRLKNADNAYLQLLGLDPAVKLSLQSYMGNEDDEGAALAALAYLLLTPDGVALSETLSEKYKLAIGDTLTVVVDGQFKRVKLAALLQTEDELSRRALEGIMLSDISVAQTLLGKPGQIDYIDLALPDDADVQPILDRLPANAHLQPAGLQTRAIEEMVQSFELSLAIASQLVLLAGIFLIYNTISFSVAQRRINRGHHVWGDRQNYWPRAGGIFGASINRRYRRHNRRILPDNSPAKCSIIAADGLQGHRCRFGGQFSGRLHPRPRSDDHSSS
jgi:putative ABC transport system permease protein